MKTKITQHTPGPNPVVTIVPESATHIAFVNGKTYTRAEVTAAQELLEFAKTIREVCKVIVNGGGKFEPLGVRVVVESLIAKADGR